MLAGCFRLDFHHGRSDSLLWGVGLLAVVLVAFAGYSFLQFNSLNARVLGGQDNGVLAAQVAALSDKVAAIEAAVLPETVALHLYFDSSDGFVGDALKNALALAPSLQRQGLSLAVEDKKGRLEELRKLGFKSLPALFVPDEDLLSNPQLQEALLTQPQVKNGVAIDGFGFVSKRKVMLTPRCTTPGKAIVYEFADFQCSGCDVLNLEVKQFLKEFEGKVDFQFRQLPVAVRPQTRQAAEAAYCAGKQGKLSEYSDRLFANPANLTQEGLLAHALALGLDGAAFKNCTSQQSTVAAVEQDVTEGLLTYGLRASPAFVVDCKYVFTASSAQGMADALCAARPDVCSGVNASATPAANATVGNATVSPAGNVTGANSSGVNVTA